MNEYSSYRKISNTRHTKSPNLNVSRLVLQLSLPNPMKPVVKSRMKMWLEQRRQAMLQLHLSDRQFYCLLKCVLYQRLDGSHTTSLLKFKIMPETKVRNNITVCVTLWLQNIKKILPETCQNIKLAKWLAISLYFLPLICYSWFNFNT